jgi:hypothetical protein
MESFPVDSIIRFASIDYSHTLGLDKTGPAYTSRDKRLPGGLYVL